MFNPDYFRLITKETDGFIYDSFLSKLKEYEEKMKEDLRKSYTKEKGEKEMFGSSGKDFTYRDFLIKEAKRKEEEEKKQTQQGTKFDQDKPRMDLLDPSFTIGVAKVLTFGANKYEANNWRKGIQFSRLISAIHRHLAAIQQGEFIDPESGEPHVYHIGGNVMFLGWMMENKPELNDLPK